jgi:predicted secreted protein
VSVQPGRNVLIKIGDGASPTEAFSEIGEMEIRRLLLRQAPLERTNQETVGRWQELLVRGARSARIEGLARFKHSTAEAAMITAALLDVTTNFRFEAATWGVLAGAFAIIELDMEGRLGTDMTWRIALASGGALVWT